MAHGSLNGMASRNLALCFLLSALLYSTIGQTAPRFELEPEFLAPLENHTVTQGRDVSFTCVVNHLQSYKVAWIKSDSRAILAMHTHMVAPNPRLSVTHNGHNTWKLHVLNVQPDDSGAYMCQVNTDPMRSQIGHMKVVIPPDIMDLDDAIDRLTSMENGDVRLRCRATGNPKPEVTWRREDGRSIVLRGEDPRGIAVKTYKNEHLHLSGILRQEMGSYLCIASNGVPPTISKRYYVIVLFKPTIKVRDRIVSAPINSDVTLECHVESSPKALTMWYMENGIKLIPDDRHIVTETVINDYTNKIILFIRRIRPSDFSTYTCFTENTLGKTNVGIHLRELHKAKTTPAPFRFNSRKKPINNSLEKNRKSSNILNSSSASRKLNSSRSYSKDDITSLSKSDEDEADNNYVPKHIDVNYSNFPAPPGTHYGSTDFPGSQYLNGATLTVGENQAATTIITYLIIFAIVLC